MPQAARIAPAPAALERIGSLDELRPIVLACSRCPLAATRHNVVFGEGDPHAKLMFIGEGPGYDEDMQGRPFVGRAGQLLNKMIAAMQFAREEVYIANVDAGHIDALGGLDSENEDIRIFKLKAQDAFAACKSGRICNCAALVALLNLQLMHQELRGRFLAQRA